MPERITVLERNQLALERLEMQAARRSASAYNQARRELASWLIEHWTGTDTMTPAQLADVLRRSNILTQLDARLLQLEREGGVILRDVVRNGSELAVEQVQRELAALPRTLRPDVRQFSMVETQMVERFVPAAIDELAGARAILGSQLRRELQAGLLQGESFPNLVKRLMAATPTGEGPAVWRNGQLSAERLTRRLVITANNAAKQEALNQVNAQGGTQVRKQWVATIGSRTTETCLRAHGQIQNLDDPFEFTGEPRFARKLMHPPAHWNCRSSIVMWHPYFEQGGLTTVSMRADAAAELAKRG